MTAYSEETVQVNFANGMYSSDLPSAIPDGFCELLTNAVATGTTVENRLGFYAADILHHVVESDFLPPSPVFSYLGKGGNSNLPVLMWGATIGSTQKIYMLREGNPYEGVSGTSTTSGFLIMDVLERFIGAVKYNDRVYYFTTDDIRYISSVNWDGISVTTGAVSGPPTGMTCAPVHFFDRMWVGSKNKLYFTEAVASPGAYPDQWSNTNFISIVGTSGPAYIYKIVPHGTRLLLFTSQGLFQLSVIGDPNNWYLRVVDESAIVNSPDCAFVHAGLVYYASIYGVFVTDGSRESVKLSGAIQNHFVQGNFDNAGFGAILKKGNIYSLHYLDQGLVLSISGYFIPGEGELPYYDTDQCFIYYSRLDNIAWSSWQFGTSVGQTKIARILGIADTMDTHITRVPMAYILAHQSTSRLGVSINPVQEMYIYDSLQDRFYAGGGSTVTVLPIISTIKTRFFDGGNLIDIKQMKYAFLEFFLSNRLAYNDADQWSYSWKTDTINITPEAANVSGQPDPDILSNEYAVTKLESGFRYRTAQLILTFSTKLTNTFKIKSLYLKQHSLRDGTQATQ